MFNWFLVYLKEFGCSLLLMYACRVRLFRSFDEICHQFDNSCLRVFGKDGKAEEELTEFGEDRVFNDLRYTINNDKLQELGWVEV